MKKEFQTPEDAISFIQNMPDRDKYAFDFYREVNGSIILQWIEYKQYTSYDGQVFNDEIWVTADNQMYCIQDLDAEHCRNIIRMIIRNTRESQQRLTELAEAALQEIHNMDIDSEAISSDIENPYRILH